MAKADVKKNFEELESWFDNMTAVGYSESMQIIGRLLASLPGGDEFEEQGYEPFDWLGWHEFELITDALQSIDGSVGVEEAASILFEEDE